MTGKSNEISFGKQERAITPKFADMIRETRIKKGYSLIELGKKIDVSPSYIHRLEAYKRKNPSISMMMLLSEALEIDIWYLLQIAIGPNETETIKLE